MNRSQRRAAVCTTRVHHSLAHHEKLTHKLAPQACVLYVPSAGQYVVEFSPTKFRLIEFPGMARLYDEDEAANAALTFREITGLPVKIRPYYCPHATQ